MGKWRYKKEAFLSALVIGLGQITKGESQRGLKLILWFYVAIPALLVISLYLSGILFLAFFIASIFLYPIFWVYSIYDALTREPK
ncbi:MAG: hypothetical protein NT099_03670 [Candidatus Saganbacteria bacterium]|nr:hypothetical protein [Candidatus Saganbacteria bacterium]